jgi:hypothetical protein
MAENESTGMLDMNSKFWRTTLLLVSMVMIFAGPTYIPYLMADIAHIDYVVSVVVGVVLLAVGLVLMWFLVRKKIIT